MRSLITLAVSLVALTAAVPAADASRPLPEIPPVHCDPMACPNPVEGAQDCAETLALGEDPETGQPKIYGDCDLRGY